MHHRGYSKVEIMVSRVKMKLQNVRMFTNVKSKYEAFDNRLRPTRPKSHFNVVMSNAREDPSQ